MPRTPDWWKQFSQEVKAIRGVKDVVYHGSVQGTGIVTHGYDVELKRGASESDIQSALSEIVYDTRCRHGVALMRSKPGRR